MANKNYSKTKNRGQKAFNAGYSKGIQKEKKKNETGPFGTLVDIMSLGAYSAIKKHL